VIIMLVTLHAGKLVFHVSLDDSLRPAAFSLWPTLQDRPVFDNSSHR